MDHERNRTRVSKGITIAILLLISSLGLYFRFDVFHNRPLWADELQQLHNMSTSLGQGIMTSRRQFQFPGDIVLIYPFYEYFGFDNKWGLAIPHVAASLLGFYFLYVLCRKYFKTIFGYIVTFVIMASNSNLIWHAFEIRPYSVLVTLSIATFLLMKYIVEQKGMPAGKKGLVALFILLCVTFHFYGMFMLFFSYLYHLVCSRQKEPFKETLFRNIKDYWYIILVIAPFLYYFVIMPKTAYMNWDTFQFIPKGVIPIAKGIVGNLMGNRKLYFLLSGLAFVFIIPNKEKFRQAALFVIVVACPPLLILWSCVVNHYWFIPRLFVWVMPLFAFLIGWCWDSIFFYLRQRIGMFKQKSDG